MQEMSEHLTDTQVKQTREQPFSQWLENFHKSVSGSTPLAWKETVDLVEKQVVSALENNTHTLKAVVAGCEGTGIAEPYGLWFQRLVQGIELCGKTQQRLWKVWFDMLRNTGPGMQPPWTALLKNWQDMMDPFTLMQEPLMSVTPGLQSAATGKTGTRERKTAASVHPHGSHGKKATRRSA